MATDNDDDGDVRSVSAPAVDSVIGEERQTVPSVRVDEFIGAIAECTVGDPNLAAYDDSTLDRLRDETDSRAVVLIEVTDYDHPSTLVDDQDQVRLTR